MRRELLDKQSRLYTSLHKARFLLFWVLDEVGSDDDELILKVPVSYLKNVQTLLQDARQDVRDILTIDTRMNELKY